MIHWLPKEALDRVVREHPLFVICILIAGLSLVSFAGWILWSTP